MLKIEDMFAGYRIVRLLGAGGMGEVYLAQHPRLSRLDAIKVLPATLSADADFADRFRREADLTASLWHPHIIGVHDCGEFEGRLWISMDYVDGTDAAHVLAAHPEGMTASDAIEIVDAIAEALDFAHHRGLLHRDVKPANILLGAGDGGRQRILLADFGIGRELEGISGLTATNMTIGTVHYAAPEQLMGEVVDGRADQYALACTAFHMLTGRHLFDESNPAVVISRHLNSAPPALSAFRRELSDMDPVMQRALAKHPSDRFDSCVDFASALRNSLNESYQPFHRSRHGGGRPRPAPAALTVLGAVTIPDQTPSAPSPSLRSAGRRALFAIVATIAVIVSGVTAAVLWPRSGGGGPESSSSGASTSQLIQSPVSATTQPITPGSAHADSTSANSAAELVKAVLPQVSEIVQIGEDNDPNHLFGRPNGYIAASVLIDSRLPRCTELGADCGAMIEQWPDQAAAQARADYIQSMRRAMPMLGQEWDTVRGNLLLRVAGTLKPSEAEGYESALTNQLTSG